MTVAISNKNHKDWLNHKSTFTSKLNLNLELSCCQFQTKTMLPLFLLFQRLHSLIQKREFCETSLLRGLVSRIFIHFTYIRWQDQKLLLYLNHHSYSYSQRSPSSASTALTPTLITHLHGKSELRQIHYHHVLHHFIWADIFL